ncbi:MAG: protein kinase domain-containing protein [Nannocystales bacterium]
MTQAPHDDRTGILPGGSAAAQRARLDEALTTPVSSNLAPPAPEPAPLLLPGTVVDRYILVDHLGSGGLGDVYKAYDPELDRRIAIKVLRSSVVDAETALGLSQDRLRREAQALAKLHHPNVVAVYDVGEHGTESFIAMAFAEGLPLHRWAEAHKPGWSRTRDVFLHAGRGLAAAHAAGLVHRDFKPENVVVGDGDSVIVLDFGLARAATIAFDETPLLDPSEGADSSLLHREVTSQEVLLGTPAYMAPELFRHQAPSHASDQFALCVSMYRTLFGAYPFARGSVPEYIRAVESGTFSVPDSDVPRWLVRVLARGMAGRPADRYPNIQDLLHALEGDRARRRRRRLALALAIPLAGVAVGAGAWLFQPEPTARELAVSEQLSQAARESAARGDFVYPPAADPQAPTALSGVLQLEDITGPGASKAQEAAAELRAEFSGALIKFGDRYYDMDGGRPFAADFYTMALVFNPDDEHAGARARLTAAQRHAVIERARTGDFTGPELAAAEVLSALTEDEPAVRSKRLRKILTDDTATGLTTRAAIEAITEELPGKPAQTVVAEAPSPSGSPDGNESETEAESENEDESDELVVVEENPAKASPTNPDNPSRSQPKLAAAEVARGDAELKNGRLGPAASHYHRALELDRRSYGALLGLARSKFEKGEYAKAARYAERATGVRPRSKAAHLLLGDAQFKTLNYAAARKAYQRALNLGSKKAQVGLDRLSNRLGSQ